MNFLNFVYKNCIKQWHKLTGPFETFIMNTEKRFVPYSNLKKISN